MTPNKLRFTPALPCVDCLELTTQGLLYPMSSQVWQLLPLCEHDIEKPAGEEESFSSITDLRHLIAHQLKVIHQIQHTRRHQARAYLHLRRQHAHAKARRALRWRLNRAYRLQAEAMEVQP